MQPVNHRSFENRLPSQMVFLISAAISLLGCISCTAGFAQTPTSGADTVVLCTPALKSALAPWIEYRQQQGHQILLFDSARRASQNRSLLKQIAHHYPSIQNIVLVGDAGDWKRQPDQLLPADLVMAKVNVNFGSEFDIATDNTLADFDGDNIPDASIGRIAATTPQQLTEYINRVIKYESDQVPTEDLQWQRRINMVAGIGGFGQMTDALIENTARQIITDKIPGAYQTSMTHGCWRSPYCPDPRRFSDTAVERFNEGCMFWVYIGHGERTRLDVMRVPKKRFSILDEQSVTRLACRNGHPIAIFLACYAGAFDSSRDCLAERMMKQPAGPIAVISGSRVTMPYAMGLLTLEMTDEFFNGQCQTVGELLKIAKQKMASTPDAQSTTDPYRQMIESMGLALSPLPGMLAQEKVEHLHLINLLGDPLLKLKRPEKITMQPQPITVDSEGNRTLAIVGHCPANGTMQLELVYRRDRFRKRPARRRKFDPATEAFAAYQQQYQLAHDLVCSKITIPVVAGPFDATIDVPDDVKGDCRVRAMLVGESSSASAPKFALGSCEIGIPRLARSRSKPKSQTHNTLQSPPAHPPQTLR